MQLDEHTGKGRCVLNKYGLLFFSVCLMMILSSGTVFGQETLPVQETASADAEQQAEIDGQAAETSGEPDPSVDGEWEGDGEDWQYRLTDGTCLKKSWLYYGGCWYYFSSSGYMQTGVKRIGSQTYYFGGNGAMAVGWAYDEDDECWYHAAEDGELTKGWLHAGGAWYWFDSKYKMYNRGYRMVDAHKYYFYENGQMAANQYVEMNYYDEN